MTATTFPMTARDIAQKSSIFEIDEALDALVEAAGVDAGANNGEVSDAVRCALATYAEAFGFKVDRIADYLKSQKAEAEIAHREAERLHARQKAAENRERRLKQMLAWFMQSLNLQKMRGERNTIALQANSTGSLVVNDTTQIPASFYRARIELPWPEWVEVLHALPDASLRERLVQAEGKFVQKELQRGILSDALARGEIVPGATLVKGHHVRLR
jgi:Siphovirus Gp157